MKKTILGIGLVLALMGMGCGSNQNSAISAMDDGSTEVSGVNELASPGNCVVSKRSPICSPGAKFLKKVETYQTAAALDFPYSVPGRQTLQNVCVKFSEIYVFESCYHNVIIADLVLDADADIDLCVQRGSLNPRLSTPIFYDQAMLSETNIDLPGVALPQGDRVAERIDPPRCLLGYTLNASTGLCEKRGSCAIMDTEPALAIE